MSKALLIANEGIVALARGDAATARDKLRDALSQGIANPQIGMALARACNLLGDAEGEAASLDAIIATDRHNLAALLAMAALKRRIGDERAAYAFYMRSLNVASNANPPQALHAALNEAQQFMIAARGRYEAHLLSTLASSGFAVTPRVQHSLDLLLGKSQLYLQQPSVFYFPGLPQRQFYERSEFEWASEFEASYSAMRDELAAILADDGEFAPYVRSNPDRPRPYQPLLDDPSWGALYFWSKGEIVETNAQRAPATMAALTKAPIPVIPHQSPIAHYSLLKSGTHIAPHHGMLNTRLICHLPLIVPDGCAIRVGSETRPWREGELLIFDDSVEHEAWNRGSSTRVILLFEIWRPEIAEDERAALATIFSAIDDYGGLDVD